jgi:hypothetical protein
MPLFVPPWNRCDDALLPRLDEAGPKVISRFGARSWPPRSAIGLEVNCHCDIIDWRSTRGFVGEGVALATVIKHLRLRRTRAADPDEPTGILTHHLQHDEACWRFAEELLHRLERHEAARWITPHQALSI